MYDQITISIHPNLSSMRIPVPRSYARFGDLVLLGISLKGSDLRTLAAQVWQHPTLQEARHC
jgi:hypothetical protein